MADTPTKANIYDYMVLGRNVQLHVGSDQLTTMVESEVDITFPETRHDLDSNFKFTYGLPDITLTFTMLLSRDLINYIRLKAIQNQYGKPTSSEWKITYQADSTAVTRTFTGFIKQSRTTRARGAIPAELMLVIRVDETNEPAT